MQTIRQTNNRARWIIFIFVLLATELYSISASAQQSNKGNATFNFYNTPKNFFVGIETLTGTRSFTVYSDHTQFNEINTLQEGQAIGAVIGTNALLFKVRHGAYKSDQDIDLKENVFALNVLPLQFTRKKPKYIDPYLIVDVSVNNILLFGNPLPLDIVPDPALSNTTTPSCTCPGACTGSCCMMEEPTDPMEEDMIPEFTADGVPVYVGKLNSVRTSVGVGVVLNLTTKKSFAKLFFEGKYGTELKGSSTTMALSSTRPSDQITISAGVIVGMNFAGLLRR